MVFIGGEERKGGVVCACACVCVCVCVRACVRACLFVCVYVLRTQTRQMYVTR